MKGFYQRRSDGQMADMPPCGLCLHKNKATYQSPCYRARNCRRIDLCRLSGMWGFRMAVSHLLLFLANSVRIFGQGICYDSNTTKGFNYWKGDVNRERFVW